MRNNLGPGILEAVGELGAQAALVVDAQGVIVECNAAAAQLVGGPPESLTGSPLQSLIPARLRGAHRSHLGGYGAEPSNRQMASGRPVRALRQDGTEVPVRITLKPVAGATSTLCLLDAAEAEPLGSSKYYRVLDSAPDAMLLVTSDGFIDFANEHCQQLFGYSKAELLGQSVELLVPAALRQAHVGHRVELTKAPQRRAMGQGRNLFARRKDGSEFAADVSLAPVATDDGLMIGVAVRDVTQQRKLEERVRAVQRLEAVGRLAGGISHDFNNILTVIASFGAFVFEGLPKGSAEAADMDEVLQAAERAKRLTAKLLAFSRQRTISPRRVNLNETLKALDRMLRRLLGESINYSTSLDPGLWTTWADPDALEQVIVNLAVNGKDAMSPHGKLTIETGNAVLELPYSDLHGAEIPPGEYVMIAVTDNGTGMDSATQAQIFEPFFTTKPEGVGTGLGLATTYGIVKQAGGYVWVYSELGSGTTFKIYLPRVSGDSEPPPPPSPIGPLPRGDETVLIAEDENQVRAVAVKILTRLGYTVLQGRTGTDALEQCQRHTGPVHLLLSDVVMPGMNGKDLARKVCELRPDVKVLYMSGYTSNVVIHQGVLDQGVELLQKPFAPDILARRVRRLLDGAGPGPGDRVPALESD